MDRDEYWDLFKGTGDIFAYLKYKNKDLILPNKSDTQDISCEKQEGGMSYGTISKFDGYGSGSSTDWRL